MMMVPLGWLGAWLYLDTSGAGSPPDRARSATPSWARTQDLALSSVARVISHYRIEVPGSEPVLGDAFGSGVLIQPTLVLTSSHLARPWRDAFAQPWDDVTKTFQLTAALDSLSVQFPGQEAVPATLFALAGNSDLALLQIPLRPNPPLAPAAPGERLSIAQEVAFLLHEPTARQEPRLLSAVRETRSPEERPASSADPFFVKAYVTQISRDATGRVAQVTFDRSFAAAGGGGPVINRKGELVGLTRGRFRVAGEIFLAGRPLATRSYGTDAVQAVSLGPILQFLKRVGVITSPCIGGGQEADR